MYNCSISIKKHDTADNDLDHRFLLYGQAADLNRETTAEQPFQKLVEETHAHFKPLGYGEAVTLDSDDVLDDELDEKLLDQVSVAGDRFDRMLKLLSGSAVAR